MKKQQKIKDITTQKSLFYAEMSHDLHQPLQAIKILLDLLKEESTTLFQYKLLNQVENSIKYLNTGLDNLLKTASLDSQTIKYHKQEFNLDTLLKSIVEEYNYVAIYKNITLLYHGKNIIISTDKTLLERIIRNLLHNALKFGHKTILVRSYELKDKVKIIIKDDGIGIKKQDMLNICKEYYQSAKEKKQQRGMGLGLAIVKSLADILKIEINIKSKWKRGTIFILTIPKSFAD